MALCSARESRETDAPGRIRASASASAMEGEQRDTNGGLDVSQRHPVFMSLPSADAPPQQQPRKPKTAPPPPPNEFGYAEGDGADGGAGAFSNSKSGRGGCVLQEEVVVGGTRLTNDGVSSNNYHSMHTPVELRKSPAGGPEHLQISGDTMRSVDESSEGSIDDGSYGNDKFNGLTDGVGWFHAKITVANSIHWANNYKIQALMFLVFICGAAVTIVFADNTVDASVGLLSGGVVTLMSCLSVCYTFLTRPTWRKHPNPIIFFRSLCDIGLVSVLVVTELYKCGTGSCGDTLSDTSCSATAALTQFFLWSSESWFFVMAIDMLSSLQSPFTDYKRNVRRYHSYVWLTGTCSCSLPLIYFVLTLFDALQHWSRVFFLSPFPILRASRNSVTAGPRARARLRIPMDLHPQAAQVTRPRPAISGSSTSSASITPPLMASSPLPLLLTHVSTFRVQVVAALLHLAHFVLGVRYCRHLLGLPALGVGSLGDSSHAPACAALRHNVSLSKHALRSLLP